MKPFLNHVRTSLFGGALVEAQVEGMIRIIAACDMAGLSDAEAAYVLATVYHETGRRMQPVREHFKESDAAARESVAAWCRKKHKRNYAAIDPETGQSYYGRGYVQLTHRENYARQAAKLGVDLVNNPDLALHPEVSALILVKGMRDGDFTGKKLADYIRDGEADWYNARRIVNGLDRASDIAGYARHFAAALGAMRAAGVSVRPEKQEAAPAPLKSADRGGFAVLVAAFLAAVVAVVTKIMEVW